MTALQELIEILNKSQKFINDNDSKEDTEISKEEPINCPKCRTSNFKNCHSIHCPMRKKEPKETEQEINWILLKHKNK